MELIYKVFLLTAEDQIEALRTLLSSLNEDQIAFQDFTKLGKDQLRVTLILK